MSGGSGVALSTATSAERFGVARNWIVAWSLLRIPLLVLLLFVFRYQAVAVFELWYDVLDYTELVIDRSSTPFVRILLAAALTTILALVLLLSRRLPSLVSYALVLIVAAILVATAFRYAGIGRRYSLIVLMILATNLAPDQLIGPITRSRLWNWFMAVGVGIAELFFFRRYINWVWPPAHSEEHRKNLSATRYLAPALPGLLAASLVAAAMVPSRTRIIHDTFSDGPMVRAEQWLRMPPHVRVVDRGNFNWIAIDKSGRYLYASGHGLERLRRYDLSDLAAPPLESEASTGRAQGFAYDPDAGELYVYNSEREELQWLEEDSLRLKRVVSIRDISPGDCWIVADPVSDTIVIASEADEVKGTPFVVVDRTTGEVLDRRDIDSGIVLVHPTQAKLYFSFFRRSLGILSYDLKTREMLDRAPADDRADRMAYWEKDNELLVTSPVKSRILRYDAKTLESKGHFETLFGVRALAIDPVRNLMLCGSVATGRIEVIELGSAKRVGGLYLGPWIRSIEVHPETAVAYISSNGALYSVQYAPAQ